MYIFYPQSQLAQRKFLFLNNYHVDANKWANSHRKINNWPKNVEKYILAKIS